MNNFAYITLYLFTDIVDVILSAVLFMMLLRVIFSLFPMLEGSRIDEFVYRVTEPFIIPVRVVVEKIDVLNSLPIDISFFLSFILLSIAADILSAIGA